MTTETRPLPEYATLTTLFSGTVGGFLLLARKRLSERTGCRDMLRVGLAGYKLGRLIAREFPCETRFVATIFGGQAAADFLSAAFVRPREG